MQAIDSQYISFFSLHSFGYETRKELCLDSQALTSHFNTLFFFGVDQCKKASYQAVADPYIKIQTLKFYAS